MDYSFHEFIEEVLLNSLPLLDMVSSLSCARPPARQLFAALLDGIEEFVPAVASPVSSPLALAEPALFVAVHLLRHCLRLLIGTNCAMLAGVERAPLSRAPFRYASPKWS